MASKSIVIITKFDNPYQFWFRRVENEENRLLMEKSCSQTMANAQSNRNFDGKIGMKVLVKKEVDFKRAVIQNIVEKNYICWLVDEGILFTTDRIYQISLDISSKPCFAIQAGLNNIGPTEMKFDFVSCKQRAQFTAYWTQGSIILAQNLLSEAKNFVFIKETVVNNVEYGQLLISDKNGIPTSLTMELVEKQFAVVDSERFLKGIISSEIEYFDNQTDALSMKTSFLWNKAPFVHNPNVTEISMKTSSLWNKAPFLHKPNVTEIENAKPSGLSASEINTWLSNNESVNVNTSTTIDSDDSSKPSVSEKPPNSAKSPEKSKLSNPLQKLLQKNQMYKCSLNLTDDSNQQENTTGTIPKRQQIVIPHTSPQHKFDNTVATDEPECDWSQFDSCIITGKGSSPIKTNVDYVDILPASYETGINKISNKSQTSSKSRHSADACQSDKSQLSKSNTYNNRYKRNDSFKANHNNHSSDSSSINQPVSSQQRKSLDSYLNRKCDVSLKSVKSIDASSVEQTSVNVKSAMVRAHDQLTCENAAINELGVGKNVRCHIKDDDCQQEVIKSESSSCNKSTSQDLLTSHDSCDEEHVKIERTGEVLEKRQTSSSDLEPPPNPTNTTAECPPHDTPAPPTHSMNRFTCHCAKCEPWNDCDDLGPEMGLRFIDDMAAGGASKVAVGSGRIDEVVRPEQLFVDKSGGMDKKDVVLQTVVSTRATLMVEGSRMKRVKVPPVLVHCNILPAPCPTLHAVPGFISSVVDALWRHGYKESKPLQVYGWPAATDGEHVLLVGGPATGKTLGHVPAVASAILDGVVRDTGREKWGREREPTVIILCVGSTKADEVYDLYCKLVGKCDDVKRLHIALAIPPLDKQYMDQFKNKVDILITTPMILCKLISTLVTNIKSLNILILEDLDVILSRFALEMAAIERHITAMLNNRTFGESIQLFMTSEHWTGNINKFLSRLNAAPFICIAAPMETVLYGNAKAQVHLIDSVAKPFHLKELIKDNYHLYKTVIVCTDLNQISELEDIFRLYSISFTTATVEMEGENVVNVEIEWDSTLPGDHKILLCDDHSLMNYFSIRNAMILVHFSLPVDSWKMFTQRFRCLFDSYSSPFVPNNNQAKCQIHIYIDDKCDKQLSRLINCFKQMGAAIPEAFVEKAKRVHEHHERLKLHHHSNPLCAHVKLTGQCHLTMPCQYRHMVDHRVDRSIQKYGHLPKSGLVRFRLLSVSDATTFYVRLMGDGDWKRCCAQHKGRKRGDGDAGEVDRLYGELVGEVQMALGVEGSRVRARKGVKVGDLCILEDGDKSLRRCRVTKIIEIERLTQLASIVEAFMLDDGNTVRIVTDNLFDIPRNIKKIPYLAVEVRLANIIPPGRDNAFSLKIRSDIQHLLQKHTLNTPTATTASAPHYYTGVVQLQLGNCLWLGDVRLMRYLRKTDVHLTSLILRNEMLGNFWGEWSEMPLKRLRDLCLKHKLSVPEIPVIQTKTSPVIEQVTPQWAFLETDSWNKVNFSSGIKPECIYVNLEKFKKQLSDLHSQILHTIQRPFYPPAGEIIPGRYFLAPDTDQIYTDMCRVLVTNIYEEMGKDGVAMKMAECFFVDYGNTEIYKADRLIYLRDDMISQLPFQAIECSFYGFKYPNSKDINETFHKFIDEFILECGTNFFRTWYIRVIKKHTVYNPCTYSNNNTNMEHTADRNAPSHFIYSIHTYLEDTSEIFSLNVALDESVPGLQCSEADDLITSEQVEEELIDFIVRGRRGESDGEGVVEGCNGADPVVDRPEVSSEVNFVSKKDTDETFENAHFDFDNFNSDDDIQISNKDSFVKQLKANSQPKKYKKSSSPVIYPALPPTTPTLTDKLAPSVSNNINQSHQLNQNKNQRNKNEVATSSLGCMPMWPLPVKDGDATLTPDVIWHQIDGHIVIEVKIPAVEEYKLKLWLGNKLTFSTNTNDKKYAVTLRLFKNVKSKFQHKALGLCVQIKLTKLDEEDWPRLVFNTIKQSCIKYNISKIEPDYDEDDEDIPRKNRRKFLDLGPEFADIPETEQYWYNEDSDYDNSESDYAVNEFAD